MSAVLGQEKEQPPGGLSSEEADNLSRSNKKAKMEAEDGAGVMETCMTSQESKGEDELKRVAVWVRVPGLLMEFYDREILWKIGNVLGKTVRVDSNTLKPRDGYWGQTTTERGGDAEVREERGREDGTEKVGTEKTNFGPWMIVQKQTRRRQVQGKKVTDGTSKGGSGAKTVTANHGGQKGSRFSALADLKTNAGTEFQKEGPTKDHLVTRKDMPAKIIDPSTSTTKENSRPKSLTKTKNLARQSTQSLGRPNLTASPKEKNGTLDKPVQDQPMEVEEVRPNVPRAIVPSKLGENHTPHPPIGSGMVLNDREPPDLSNAERVNVQQGDNIKVLEDSKIIGVGSKLMKS
ncbi:hypothetical protein SESBI_32609 [Sesbania bispinosa]|nr:hypothetical protein SESBI_32609 [Sesbania bispinosa]